MRRVSLYRWLTFLCLVLTAGAGGLAAVALGFAHGFEAAAAALCAAVFLVPGLLFLRYWQRLESRALALVHVAEVAETEGVADARSLAEKLGIPEADVPKIVRTAIREGRLRGEVDPNGRFVAASTPRCPACDAPLPRTIGPSACPSCGKPSPGGL